MTAWARFCRNRLALLGLVLVVVLALSAALAPWLAPLDPARQSLIEKRTRPGAKYLLGADEFGRDILSRVIYGSRVALLVGVLSMLIALVGGLLLGTVAGFTGGWLDTVVMRVVEILLAFPYLLLALAIVAMLGPGVLNTTLAVGIWGVPAVTRMVRGSVLALRETEYVGAARALGAAAPRGRALSALRCAPGACCNPRRFFDRRLVHDRRARPHPRHRSGDPPLWLGHRRRRCVTGRASRRDRRAARPLRLRQDDAATGRGRVRPPERRLGADRRQARRSPARQSPQRRDRLPELRALPAHDGGRQHRLRPPGA